MDAIKFVNEKVRMCNAVRKNNTCQGCRLHGFGGCDFDHLAGDNRVEEAVKRVEEWSKENPRKTRQSVFLEQYPETLLDSHRVIALCPMPISAEYRDSHGECKKAERVCTDCRKEFWSQEV